jgi:hypothetical protein
VKFRPDLLASAEQCTARSWDWSTLDRRYLSCVEERSNAGIVVALVRAWFLCGRLDWREEDKVIDPVAQIPRKSEKGKSVFLLHGSDAVGISSNRRHGIKKYIKRNSRY